MSLSEPGVDTARCPKCGSEVRDNSVFCYNCGGRVVSEDGTEGPIADKTMVDESPAETPPVGDTVTTRPAPGLRSARDIRRREKTSDRKPREVVWEASGAEPDLQLMIIAAGVVVFTIVVVLLVLYVR